MTKAEFDQWCESNLKNLAKELSKKFPKSRETIWEDFSDFYDLIINKHIPDLKDPLGFLHSFIWHKHYRFYSNQQRGDLMVNTKRFKIELLEDYSKYANLEDSPYEDQTIDSSIWQAITILPLDQKNLFQLYYIDNLSTRQIAKRLNCSHTGIAKQLNKIRKKIGDSICSSYLQRLS